MAPASAGEIPCGEWLSPQPTTSGMNAARHSSFSCNHKRRRLSCVVSACGKAHFTCSTFMESTASEWHRLGAEVCAMPHGQMVGPYHVRVSRLTIGKKLAWQD